MNLVIVKLHFIFTRMILPNKDMKTASKSVKIYFEYIKTLESQLTIN